MASDSNPQTDAVENDAAASADAPTASSPGQLRREIAVILLLVGGWSFYALRNVISDRSATPPAPTSSAPAVVAPPSPLSAASASTGSAPSAGPSDVAAPSAGPSAMAAPSAGPSAMAAPSAGPSAMAAPSAGPAPQPANLQDPFRDLFLHDMIGGIIEFQESGPEALRLTAAQRNQLRPLWPKIRARLERNEAQPSDLDEQVRTVLAQDQKAAIRALLSGRKVHLPPTLKAYVTPFESLLDGTYQKGALAAAEAAPPRTSPSARPATPQSIPTPRPQTSRPATAADPFEDIYLHDAIGAILVIEREGPPEARLTAAQRLALKQLWPEIRKRLEANDWKPAALDVQVVGTLSSAQRKALREVRAKGRLQLPPNLTVYLEPFERVLSR